MSKAAAKPMCARAFTAEDQSAFAGLSGDYNPLHLDPVLARRLIYGAPVVHGIHCLLWALDQWLKDETGAVELMALDAEFPKPLRVGEEARLSITSVGGGFVKLEITRDGLTALKADCHWQRAAEPFESIQEEGNTNREPRVLQPAEVKNRKGELGLSFDSGTASQMFPHAAKRLSPLQIAVLLATTRLVGMECPGMHSVFYSLTLGADSALDARPLQYEVTAFHRRFQMVIMKVTGGGFSGEIKSFFRPHPQEQIGYAKAKELVGARDFAGQRALIVGGSRGLGEVAAKLLAAGGAEVRITYHHGQTEAERVVREINSANGVAACCQLDVLSAVTADSFEPIRGWAPNALYYFATPFIFAGNKGAFSDKLFQRFCGYYVGGFMNVLNAMDRAKLQRIFHPSSIAVEELPPDMMEYAAAKSAAESLCSALERNQGVPIYKPRLPRLNTDQTVSLMPAGNQEPAPILLEHLRRFQAIQH